MNSMNVFPLDIKDHQGLGLPKSEFKWDADFHKDKFLGHNDANVYYM